MKPFYYQKTKFAESVEVWASGKKQPAFCVTYFPDSERFILSVDGNPHDKETVVEIVQGNPAFTPLKNLKAAFVSYNLNQGFFGDSVSPTGNSVHFLSTQDSVKVVFGNNPYDQENANKMVFSARGKNSAAAKAFRSFLQDMGRVERAYSDKERIK